ncbi:hypothetical protein K250101E9_12400 [Enterocloster aldenensis]
MSAAAALSPYICIRVHMMETPSINFSLLIVYVIPKGPLQKNLLRQSVTLCLTVPYDIVQTNKKGDAIYVLF